MQYRSKRAHNCIIALYGSLVNEPLCAVLPDRHYHTFVHNPHAPFIVPVSKALSASYAFLVCDSRAALNAFISPPSPWERRRVRRDNDNTVCSINYL
ncbi:hypothetical protein FKM82_018510 [Ascaphus truei]